MKTLDLIKSKIFNAEQLKHQLEVWKFLGKKISFTNGCFDILHLGHIDYLAKAADFGNVLILGLNTDSSVQRLKGSHRPINGQDQRAMIMASLHFVDAVTFFDQDTPLELIKMIMPDFLIKGSDYKAEEIVGYREVTENGGKVVTIDFLPGYSTSIIEGKILSSKKL
ncbi:MAG: D-glycero-beta-D-manno-heptose 1-phosphate adenylyltransferase [Bacteroidetes bacterium]|nr:MAG: D-glycero-beta-D-manno-heptose 1-phosphate adenylyltransferase [Bacteroidota bacterium]REK04811.1 MAG: D-glycero-beta-D-manno-heptose 1-phosphate adenylyltransferase [Bacteroidota bacterium]REK36284.1 MAG: D-glycero-beta-D-manno-heptose 1-phosphate adenylyltransferase [Bacteroidota bacterium]REK51052.1 MAG: D-glycero-beta-D-manno-heptose 1-phosphate adenylyltransferase [Bacteroidota bacterium]